MKQLLLDTTLIREQKTPYIRKCIQRYAQLVSLKKASVVLEDNSLKKISKWLFEMVNGCFYAEEANIHGAEKAVPIFCIPFPHTS